MSEQRKIRPENHPIAHFVSSLDEGVMELTIPSNLSKENADDVIDLLNLIIRRLRRGMPDTATKDAAAAEYIQAERNEVREVFQSLCNTSFGGGDK